MRNVIGASVTMLALGFLLGASPMTGGGGDPAEGEGAPGGEGAVGTEEIEREETSGGGVQIAEHETLGPYLTDVEGKSLYLYLTDAEGASDGGDAAGDDSGGAGDPAEGEGAPGAEGAPGGEGAVGTEGQADGTGSGSGVSTCYDRCAESWPPLLAEGEPTAGEGVAAQLLGTTEREDGSSQVIYNGWPLYYFSRDVPGFASGQGAGGTWYLVSPEGQAIGVEEEEPEEAAETEGEEADPMVAGALVGAGRPVYEANCTACHGEQGDGGRGPALAGNANLSDTQTVVRQIINGAPPYMPKFGDQLSNAEIAAVATFIRNSWGNELGEVTEEEVGDSAEHP